MILKMTFSFLGVQTINFTVQTTYIEQNHLISTVFSLYLFKFIFKQDYPLMLYK